MISSELVENITSNEVKEEYSRDLSLPRSYEAAMEALSSLISGRKRGKKNVVLGKYSKLERMMMYVKVIWVNGVFLCLIWKSFMSSFTAYVTYLVMWHFGLSLYIDKWSSLNVLFRRMQ